jgi:hypothetical protein
MKSSKRMVPCPILSNRLTSISTSQSERRYPKEVKAKMKNKRVSCDKSSELWLKHSPVFNSFLSIDPLLSVSNDLKQFCQSVTYFHKAPKSAKLEKCFQTSQRKNFWDCTLEANSSCVLFIEHSDHESDSFTVKRSPSSIAIWITILRLAKVYVKYQFNKCLPQGHLQLVGADLSRPILVDSVIGETFKNHMTEWEFPELNNRWNKIFGLLWNSRWFTFLLSLRFSYFWKTSHKNCWEGIGDWNDILITGNLRST